MVIILRKYSHHSQTGAIKLQNIISVNEELNFEQISSRNGKYAFKSAICHKGINARTGHYVTVVTSGNKYLYCDDEKIKYISPDMLLDTAYIILYSKINEPCLTSFEIG